MEVFRGLPDLRASYGIPKPRIHELGQYTVKMSGWLH